MQHFLLSKAAKTLSLAQVFRMTDLEAETAFKAIRWASTNGTPVCPSCGSVEAGPSPEWGAPLPLQGLQEGFHHYQRDAVRQPQAAPQGLSGGHCDLLQRSEGQERPRDQPCPGAILQVGIRPPA